MQLARVGRRRPRRLEAEGQGHKALLCPVVQIALDALPLRVARLDDPRPRGANLVELRADLGAEPLVFERERSDRAGGADEPGCLGLEARVVDEHRHRLPFALHLGDRSLRGIRCRQLDRLTGPIDVARSGRCLECQLQARVAQRPGHHGPQVAERDAAAELHRKVSHGATGQPAAKDADAGSRQG